MHPHPGVKGYTFMLTDEVLEVEKSLCLNPAQWEDFDPEPEKIIPEEGAWVTVIRPPHTAISVYFGETFWATRDENADQYGFVHGGMVKITIHTHRGDLCLFPHEYAVLGTDEITKFYAEGELIFHADEHYEHFLNQQLHYVRSRGIGLEQALPLVLGSLKENVGWFELAPGLKGILGERDVQNDNETQPVESLSV